MANAIDFVHAIATAPDADTLCDIVDKLCDAYDFPTPVNDWREFGVNVMDQSVRLGRLMMQASDRYDELMKMEQ